MMDQPFIDQVVEGVKIYSLGGAVLLFMVLAGETFLRWREPPCGSGRGSWAPSTPNCANAPRPWA